VQHSLKTRGSVQPTLDTEMKRTTKTIRIVDFYIRKVHAYCMIENKYSVDIRLLLSRASYLR
jgi:hypothetical protein